MRLSPAWAKAWSGAAIMLGRMAACAVIVRSEAIAWSIAARLGSLGMSMITVSAVRKPGSNRDEAMALRRKIAAHTNNSAEANTWIPISAFRERPGRASLTSSPRSVRTGSIRVACSAGSNANNAVATIAPTTRNTATRQSAAGTDR